MLHFFGPRGHLAEAEAPRVESQDARGRQGEVPDGGQDPRGDVAQASRGHVGGRQPHEALRGFADVGEVATLASLGERDGGAGARRLEQAG